MRFIFADSQDYIDPGFDFNSEKFSANRLPQRDDVYAHEYFETPPYDGMLVSRATVGDDRWKGKFSTSQSMRFRREGARKYLRYDPASNGGMLLGDCGAFSYVKEEVPPYTIPEMVEYYVECGFTHAVSIDHVILNYDERLDEQSLFDEAVPADWIRRYEITLRLAMEFRQYCDRWKPPFHPIGVAQGWSPKSYSAGVRKLVDMGYDYVALGGLVPLKVPQIHRILEAVRQQVGANIKLHLFGFTKADHIHEFVKYSIESFDSTSPLIRAFKDGTRNFYANENWYTAIRVPDANESRHFKADILAGVKRQSELRELELSAMMALRGYENGQEDIDAVLNAVVLYERQLTNVDRTREYRQTLTASPWTDCPCRACRDAGIDVIIFRGANRNRRRGFHNLWEFYRRLRTVSPKELMHNAL